MKILFKSENGLMPHEITKHHIVVGTTINNELLILYREGYQKGIHKFGDLSDGFIEGNSYNYSKADLVTALYKFNKNEHIKDIEVFDQKDWKEALKWLIDNCK
ncbi:MAG: hypothetical protein F6K19_01770 [Cyanothece sp. SIO1E1]|nr:hypothetical protein [Cyanothece sp. SIO1E1]